MKATLTKLLNMNELERQAYMNENADQLIAEMIKHIGYPEDEMRDKLNYRLFVELLASQLYSHEQMAHIASLLKGEDYLFLSIGERDTDTVFTRSFSALWLSNLLNVDRQLRFLNEEDATCILETSSHYLGRENDVRGFVGEKGWAHSIAHGADLSSAIISHPSFNVRFAPVILQGIKKSFWNGTVFVDDEEERLVTVFENLIAKDFPEEVLIEWIEQVFDKLQFYLMEVGYTPEYFAARTNTLHFMKTLYFTLKFSKKSPEIMGIVSLFIAKWMKQ
ncbi:DUF2785 domain-containing protein [Ureibacillus chungkukjangi]|uniref:Uncharacterized protein DUF2785 n=1 Tax=Ureibacillus chungkukjangi TaxID=1202712 RepID=A0A318U615_9BACL|nr:DUF2785 domain-containing protein [Ureibacillus chungkukjangi]MCM3388374.1 DUF2785 domain-containing protein [Ureibacillus chungkukjangi]PYF07379.1 uncharacterized protein DUF2785 [Ureibacillus chungkukjangi]